MIFIVICTKSLPEGGGKRCINVQPPSPILINLHPDVPNQMSIMMSFLSRINLRPVE